MSNVLERLRHAMLPDFVRQTTLPKLGQAHLRELIAKDEYKTNEGMVSFLVRGPSREAQPAWLARIAAVFGKEILLNEEKVVYMPASMLRMAAQAEERHGEHDWIISIAGSRPYLILPDLQDESWSQVPQERAHVFGLIQKFFYAGVPLVICDGTGRGYFGDLTFEQMVESFRVLMVNGLK